MKVMIPLAEGFEEIEAATIIDVLRRAEIEVVTVGMASTAVEGAHGIRLMTDTKFSDISLTDFDAVVLPGGDPGYKNLMKSSRFMDELKLCDEAKRIIGAICAAPLVLAKAGILEDKKATVFPTMEAFIPRPRSGAVVVDKNIITGRSPGDAMEFSLKLVEVISGKEKSRSIKSKLIIEGN